MSFFNESQFFLYPYRLLNAVADRFGSLDGILDLLYTENSFESGSRFQLEKLFVDDRDAVLGLGDLVLHRADLATLRLCLLKGLFLCPKLRKGLLKLRLACAALFLYCASFLRSSSLVATESSASARRVRLVGVASPNLADCMELSLGEEFSSEVLTTGTT